MKDRERTRREIAVLLETYGGERERWPDVHAQTMARTIADDPALAARAEAERAFDRLIRLAEHASAPAPVTAALTASIMEQIGEAASSAPGEDTIDDNVIAFPGPRGVHGARATPHALPRRGGMAPVDGTGGAVRRANGTWKAALMLAASLLLGVYLGTHDDLAGGLVDIAAAAGVPYASDAVLALATDDQVGLLEEAL